METECVGYSSIFYTRKKHYIINGRRTIYYDVATNYMYKV